MAKGKSSASSATRKKHARKAAGPGPSDDPPHAKEKKQKGKGKKGKEPRKKVYIPPVKPAPVRPDPLDTHGIAQVLPAELLVVLRKLAKKDTVTKRRALEDLQADWIETARKEEWRLAGVVDAIPVWLHHVPTLFLHPSRRIRSLAVTVHASLLNLPSPVAEQVFSFLRDVADAEQTEYIIGTWCMAAFDVDRQVSAYARDSWSKFTTVSTISGQEASARKLRLNDETLRQLWDLIHRTLLDPSGVYMYVNPPQPPVPPPPSQRKGAGKNTGPVPKDDDAPNRAKTDEDDESETDRRARLRIGALGAAEWVLNAYCKLTQDEGKLSEFLKPLDNIALWSALYYGQFAPFVSDEMEAFGFNQPGVRRSAWALLFSVLQNCKSHLQQLLPTLSVAALRSAWIEPDSGVRGAMWQPLMSFLKAYPSSWTLASAPPPEVSDDEEDSGSEDGEDDDVKPRKAVIPESRIARSPPYDEFRQFLELGCMGSPIVGYPAVLVVLATIPSSILASVSAPLQTLFTSFWAAIDGRALSGLDRAAASAAFLSSVLECSVYMARRLVGADGESLLAEDEYDPRMTARALVCEQVRRAWEELTTQHLKVDEKVAADQLARTLKSMSQIDEDLTDTVWNTLAESIKARSVAQDNPVPTLLSSTLQVFKSAFSPPESRLAQANEALTAELIQSILSSLETVLGEENAHSISSATLISFASILDVFGQELFTDAERSSSLDITFSKHAYQLLTLSPKLLLVYFIHCRDDTRRLALWQTLLRSVADHHDLSASLPPLVAISKEDGLSDILRPSSDELDDVISDLLVASSRGSTGTASYELLRSLLQNPDPFILPACFTAVISSICTAFLQYVQDCLHGDADLTSSQNGLLELLQDLVQTGASNILTQESLLTALPDIFVFAYVVPLLGIQTKPSSISNAKSLWESAHAHIPDSVQHNIASVIKQRLHDIVLDCHIPVRHVELVELFERGVTGLDVDVLHDILSTQEEVDHMLDILPGQPSSVSLAVYDMLVFSGDWDEPEDSGVLFDKRGYSCYARAVDALLLHLIRRRDLAKNNLWILRHLYALELYAQDLLDVPGSHSVVFSSKVARDSLKDLISRIDQLAAYLLAEDHEDGWLAQVASRIMQKKTSPASHGIELLLQVLCAPAHGAQAFRESRILHAVLRHSFAGANKQDAEQFLVLARSIEKTAPHASLAIIYSVTQYAPEPPRLDRLRNELAAGMLGISPSKANSEGLWTLRRLAAIAPDPESDIVYLPIPRAVNLMKACQQWITSDEDLDEEVDQEMTSVFLHLAPILQNVPGSHWDLIYDVIENNLENCSFDEPSTLPLLSRTLKLITAIQDLALTNKALRSSWDERKAAILKITRDLVTQKSGANRHSTPLSVCRELALIIVQDLPQSLIGNDTLSKMCHLVTDASEEVPQMAYKMLREAASKRTEYLVVEASIETEEPIQLDLPAELVELLQNSFSDEELDERVHGHTILGYLLAWMLAFDLFSNASLRVKSGYMDHLRRENLITDYFLPLLFSLLQLHGGTTRPFKLDIWEVDEYYLEMYSADAPVSLPLLAAHLYYRALLLVPSLIRNWLLECRDRQLSSTVTTYTSTYFSPAIIRAELAQVKDPVQAAELPDENFSIKVASAINEITAAFAVDEHSLELKLRLPPDFPLHTIGIKDSNRVGVTENRWRAWILGVQQILTFRSGSIVDGLAFFKKNVSSHFEGQSECAICYSIISVMDGSLPKKPCKTCKNRFHAGCLYKWFNSSHSSSCPLCRSEII